jgi:hypothetical protein
MNYEQLFVLVLVATFALSGTVLSIVAASACPWIERRSARLPARRRASLWVALRLSPTLTALFLSLAFGLAFVRHEPRHASEPAGGVLLGLAAFAFVLLAAAVWRVVSAILRTASCHRLVRRIGVPLDVPNLSLPAWQVPTDFPLAAVSGVLRPRLILSSRIIHECPEDELGLVLRHEAAHASRRDNLVRLALLACPDALAFMRGRGNCMRNWHHAVEEAADEAAVGSDSAAGASLASALVRVGRMSGSDRPSWMPALALFDGHPLEKRVRLLLTREGDDASRPVRLNVKLAGAFAVAAAMWLATGPRLLHACLEWGVRNLP